MLSDRLAAIETPEPQASHPLAVTTASTGEIA